MRDCATALRTRHLEGTQAESEQSSDAESCAVFPDHTQYYYAEAKPEWRPGLGRPSLRPQAYIGQEKERVAHDTLVVRTWPWNDRGGALCAATVLCKACK